MGRKKAVPILQHDRAACANGCRVSQEAGSQWRGPTIPFIL